MLWIDKHCPKQLEELHCNSEITHLLQRLSKSKDIPHLLFYGKSGGGKTTRILALLRAIFGPSIDKMKIDKYTHSESNTEVLMSQSQHHMLISSLDLGVKDRVIVQEVIRELSATPGALSFFNSGPSYRVFVFQDAEALSEVAQAGLRRTLEKYVRNARVILHVQQISSIITPLRSRCLCIRIPLPTINEIVGVLQKISDYENIKPSNVFLEEIAHRSHRNLRRAILYLETAATQNKINNFTNWDLPWEAYISEIVNKIIKHQSPKVLGECREMLYDLLASCIPPETILNALTRRLFENPQISPSAKLTIYNAAATFSHRMSIGSKPVWHIGAFIANVMMTIISQH